MNERPPAGGWLGPRTTGWPDLKERDKPAQHRDPLPKDRKKP